MDASHRPAAPGGCTTHSFPSRGQATCGALPYKAISLLVKFNSGGRVADSPQGSAATPAFSRECGIASKGDDASALDTD